MNAVQAERLIGTVAFALNTVANDQRPVIECELPLDGSRFTGWLPPVVSSPSFVIRKHARLIYTLDDYLAHNIRCNCISPARVHTPFVDNYLRKNYPGREPEMFEKLSKAQPVGRMAEPPEVASLALFLCSDEAAFITGVDYPIDGGFFNLRG